VLNNANAVFYLPNDLSAMSAAFSRLLADAPLRTALGDQARQDVLQYSWQRRMRRILEFWSQYQ
jgi:glycosyltransferase involved in cell wall biosynthesis